MILCMLIKMLMNVAQEKNQPSLQTIFFNYSHVVHGLVRGIESDKETKKGVINCPLAFHT